MTDPALIDLVAGFIRDRREVRRFIGRRSIDKTHGEVIFQPDPDSPRWEDEQQVVETIAETNFAGEIAAAKRAEQLADEWTARRIIDALAGRKSPR